MMLHTGWENNIGSVHFTGEGVLSISS